MRKALWVLAGLLAFSGCKKDGATGSDAPGVADGGGVAGLVAEEATGAGPYVVTPEKLTAYVAYQRRMLEVYGSQVKGLQGLGALVDAGTPEAMAEVRAGLKVVEAKAKAESEARTQAGLSVSDVNGLAEVVTAVISQRQLGRTLQYEEELRKLEELQEKLPPEQRQELAAQVASMRHQVESFQKLTDVRREYGDANVDVVLTREDELMKNYQEMLRVFTGTRR
ncbi:hypothetical protein HUA74_02975 [Myxococcus sp. CA051A]|uniref:hypothetical protein n=1 Tax=unclassified Myxococcus TaxID=2648731 RepID=UPI00157B70A9|nr:MULTISPECIES: hypothetical protein [unclassified Myxococcus]NTX00990.1 hypothetical protein [Myxococcus sp. CA040A]NTX33321.1 hypothetical protein [Myxococcus sp. CA033]NTX59615.1 hypothetical protein [Myxococcus sp. CA051A]